MDVVQHQILSLDFWQDTVSYEGKNFPSGTIGCDALNIPAALIQQITELCGSLNLFMGAMQLGMANAELFTSARESALQIVHKLKDIPPFSYLDEKQITAYIQKVFSNEYLENAMAYALSLIHISRTAVGRKIVSFCFFRVFSIKWIPESPINSVQITF